MLENILINYNIDYHMFFTEIYNNTKLNKNSIDTLKFIAEDICHQKNPIKYHNKYFNNNWNKHYSNIEKLFFNTSNVLIDIINTTNKKLIDDSKIDSNKWNNIYHELPINYEYYQNNKGKIVYNDFCINYYNRNIEIKNINFTDYICKYSNLKRTSDKLILDELNFFQNGFFIGLDIKLYVENNIDSYEKYIFSHIDINLFFVSNIDQIYKSKLITQFYIISKWMHILFGNPNNKINFIYIDTPLEKKTDKTYNFLSSYNVNSGLSSKKKIMIWRSEESFKVFIHELIHYLDKDVKHDNNFNKIINYKIGNIDYPVLINETITELQTQFLYMIYINILLTIIIKKNNNQITNNDLLSKLDLDISKFNTLYNYEQIFSWYQFAKIMKFYSIKKFEKEYLINKFNQSSNIYSYFILKSILGINFGDIIFELDHIKNLINTNIGSWQNNLIITNTILDSNNDSNLNECNVHNCKKLVKYITKIINKPQIKLINKIIKHLYLNNDSLRMTVVDIDL